MYYDNFDFDYQDFEFDDIANRYLKETRELFEERVKDYIEQTKREKEKLEKEKQELIKLRQELNEKQLKLTQREEEIDNHKNIVIQELMSKYGLDLTPKQKVYVIAPKVNSIECDYCNHTGELTKIIDGIEYKAKCPKCKGLGHICSDDYEIATGEVTSVKLNLYWDTEKESLDLGHSYYFYDENITVYLGKLSPHTYKSFSRKDIYTTLEQAQEAIDIKRNESNNN